MSLQTPLLAWRVALAVVLIAGVGHAQAVAPLPEPVSGPVIEIAPLPMGWRNGSAVPAGAGLVAPMTPLEAPPSIPRSPNRRVLPASNEPGLWAADGAPSDPAVPSLLGLALPLADELKGWNELRRIQLCGDVMDELLRRTGMHPRAMALPDDVRRCLAAQLFRMCVLGYEANYRDAAKSDASKKRTYQLYRRMSEAADGWLDTSCKKVPRSAEAEAIFAQAANQRLKDRKEFE